MYLNRKSLWKLHLEIIEFHKKFADKQFLFDNNKKLRFCNKWFGIALIVSVIGCIGYPIFDSIFLAKRKVLGFGFLIPFTDPAENFGYLLNFLFQSIQVCISGYEYAVFLRILCLFFAYACSRIDILENTVQDLNLIVTDTQNDEQ